MANLTATVKAATLDLLLEFADGTAHTYHLELDDPEGDRSPITFDVNVAVDVEEITDYAVNSHRVLVPGNRQTIKVHIEGRGTYPANTKTEIAKIGSADLRRHGDGTITVLRADPIVAMARDVYDLLEPPHRQPDGTIWLDTAGQWRYRITDETGPELLLARIEPADAGVAWRAPAVTASEAHHG